MEQNEIHAYIAQARSYGHSDEAIRAEFYKVGWSDPMLDPYFTSVTPSNNSNSDSSIPQAAPVFDQIYTSINQTPAKPWKRLLNYWVDGSVFAVAHAYILFVITTVLLVLTPLKGLLQNKTFWILYAPITYALFYCSYYFIWEKLTGRTITKFITRTRVIAMDGTKPSTKAIFIRSIVRLISIPFLYLLSGSKLRALHDTLSKTLVVPNQKTKR